MARRRVPLRTTQAEPKDEPLIEHMRVIERRGRARAGRRWIGRVAVVVERNRRDDDAFQAHISLRDDPVVSARFFATPVPITYEEHVRNPRATPDRAVDYLAAHAAALVFEQARQASGYTLVAGEHDHVRRLAAELGKAYRAGDFAVRRESDDDAVKHWTVPGTLPFAPAAERFTPPEAPVTSRRFGTAHEPKAPEEGRDTSTGGVRYIGPVRITILINADGTFTAGVTTGTVNAAFRAEPLPLADIVARLGPRLALDAMAARIAAALRAVSVRGAGGETIIGHPDDVKMLAGALAYQQNERREYPVRSTRDTRDAPSRWTVAPPPGKKAAADPERPGPSQGVGSPRRWIGCVRILLGLNIRGGITAKHDTFSASLSIPGRA
ncbi:MAG: hypothetical protein Q8S13_10635, partial [Dehalococcoidia bacterium]|nr:hypothetical protein [Dehalococcoidia bacterium]